MRLLFSTSTSISLPRPLPFTPDDGAVSDREIILEGDSEDALAGPDLDPVDVRKYLDGVSALDAALLCD